MTTTLKPILIFLAILVTSLCYSTPGLKADITPQQCEKPLLVIGCARSGTGYIATLLKQAGFPIDHERVGKNGLSAWTMTVPVDKVPWGPRNPNSFCFTHIFHQVRHPLKVISSAYTSEPKISWQYIIDHVPEITWEDPHLVKCAKYWYYWNLMAAERAEWSYRVEEIANVLDEFERRLEITLDRTALDRVPKNVNTRLGGRKHFTWNDLRLALDPELFENIQLLAEFYGYSVRGEG